MVTRAWPAEAALIGLAALLGAGFLAEAGGNAAQRGPWYPAADLVAGAVACLALLLQRRWPVAVAVVLIPGLILSPATMGATAVALLGVALARSWWVTAAVLLLHATFITTLFGLATTDRQEFWEGTLVVLALDVALVASGLLVRSQRLLVQSLRDRATEAGERERLRVEDARHTERERIAREMHDVLAHRISLLAVHAGALEVRRSAPEEERQAAAVIRQSAYAALEDLREVLGMLRSGTDDGQDRPQPTLADLPALVEQSRQAGAEVTVEDTRADRPDPPDGIARHAYRVVQEGLTNARKHAAGAPVRVRLGTTDAGLSVEITNPLPSGAGTGIPGSGRGLIGLRERVDIAGGRLEHGRTADGSFRLYAWLP